MNTRTDFDRTAEAWLADGPTELADRVLDAALREVHRTDQRRRQAMPRRTLQMSMQMRAAASVAVIALVGLAAIAYLGRPPGYGAAPGPSLAPSGQPPPSVAGATPVAAIELTPSTWPKYRSTRYGFTIGHPADWSEHPSSRAWTIKDDAKNFLTPAAEAFTSPGAAIRASAWAIPLAAGSGIDSREALLSWITSYCSQTDSTPCIGLRERTVQLCNEYRDCHPGLLIAFDNEVQAFFTGGNFGQSVIVVAVWWDEHALATAPYGGSTRLLEAFLSTMNVVPATGDQLDAWPTPTP